jgi:hypothetical protein
MSRKCVNNPDNVCYICGEVIFASRKYPITPTIKKAYFLYFGCKVWDQDKKWAAYVCCICKGNWMTSARNPRRLALKLIPQRQKKYALIQQETKGSD